MSRPRGRPASQASAAGPPCPHWCDAEHIDADRRRTHVGMVRYTPLAAMPPVDGQAGRLFFDLAQSAEDFEPVIRLRRDGRPLLRLTPGEALQLALGLVVLVDQAHAERGGRA